VPLSISEETRNELWRFTKEMRFQIAQAMSKRNFRPLQALGRFWYPAIFLAAASDMVNNVAGQSFFAIFLWDGTYFNARGAAGRPVNEVF